MRTVVIDAGHGGKDPGNLGTGRYKAKEKDISLEVALMVGGYIKEQFPEIKVVYTRSTDVFIGLDERALIANKANADIFISIHCNAFKNPESSGVETYVLGLHRNQENLEVAMKENSAIYMEDDYKTKYEGFDPNSPESIIALTIMQSAYLQQSLAISSYIQEQFKNRVGRKDRGVKQAGFLVLRKTTMPSILVELGFLTNKAEEDFLNSDNGKAFMASAIFRGFKEYKDRVEDPLPTGSVQAKPSNAPAQSKVEEDKAKQKELEAAKLAAQKAKTDSIAKVQEQAKLKAVADSLARKKEQLLVEQKKREEELARKAKEEEKARMKAKVDSLERLKQAKILEFEKEKKELEENQAKELAAKKAKEDAERKAKELALKKELETKAEAKTWLEEIKEVKETELEEAKRQAYIEEEKERLEAIKKQKEDELAEAKRLEAERIKKEDSESSAAAKLIAEQARIDSLANARQKAESAALAKLELHRQDSIKAAREVRERDLAKAKQESAAATDLKTKQTQTLVTIDSQKAATPEEAELLFLQLRKKQLEQRIAELKDNNVSTPSQESMIAKRTEDSSAGTKPSATSTEQSNGSTTKGVIFKVQITTSPSPLRKEDPQFKGQKVWQYQQDALYKYTVGDTKDFDEITKLQGELRNLGFKGAFVVAFKDGERIKVSEARELIK